MQIADCSFKNRRCLDIQCHLMTNDGHDERQFGPSGLKQSHMLIKCTWAFFPTYKFGKSFVISAIFINQSSLKLNKLFREMLQKLDFNTKNTSELFEAVRNPIIPL